MSVVITMTRIIMAQQYNNEKCNDDKTEKVLVEANTDNDVLKNNVYIL